MPEPQDMVLPMLTEMREEIRRAFVDAQTRVEQRFMQMDTRLERIEKRQEAQKDAFAGESVLARYAAKDVEERLEALEREIAEIRSRR